MIGLSVSGCVLSIVKGEVPIAMVEKIIGRTAAKTDKEWDWLITRYKKFWGEHAQKCEEILRELLMFNKIEQPKLTHNNYPVIVGDNIWVEDAEQIDYADVDPAAA